jgi:hypothetical protein
MASNLPRLSHHISVPAMSRFKALQGRLGMKPAQLLIYLIDREFENVDRYIQAQVGHQSVLALALTTAVVRKELSAKEIEHVRGLASEAATHLFGPVPKVPYDFVSLYSRPDPRLWALCDALMKA